MVKCSLNLRARNNMRCNGYLWVIELQASFFFKCVKGLTFNRETCIFSPKELGIRIPFLNCDQY